MTQADRDRLVALKKAKQKLITQRQAADELGLSVRHVKRLLGALKQHGDKAVVHGLRGRTSNRKIEGKIEREAVKILSREVYRGFGPTLAAEYLRDRHAIQASKETVRQWMLRAQLWRGKKHKLKEVHTWRPRRSRCGELVQWDTSEHDWLEGRGEKLNLIAMIDDATSRLWARFARHDSTAENMRLLWSYLEKFGRPLAFYTDRGSVFQTTEKRKRDEPGVEKDPVEMPPTQIGRALQELGIGWIPARSSPAKGRIERSFQTAQDRLVKGLRVAGAKTLQQANAYLVNHYQAWWERELTRAAENPDDAHRRLENSHNLAASLSHVEMRHVRSDYTLRWDGKLYRIERGAVTAGLRGANVRVELRLDGTLAVRFRERYVPIKECSVAEKVKTPSRAKHPVKREASQRGSDWNRNFDLKKAPKVWQAARDSGYRRNSL